MEGTLIAQIASDATSASVKVKDINSTTPTWLTAAHRVTMIQETKTSTKVEVMAISSASQSGSTVTLTIGTRGLPLDGTGFSGTGTPQVFTSGAKVIVTWDAQAARQTAFKDIANTFTATTTLTAPLLISGASSYTGIPEMTTAQRTALTPTQAGFVYDTDLGQVYKWEGGAWAAVDTGSLSNAADNTAGKVDIASAAEIGAGTATDGTSGAINVIPVSQTAKTSSGAGDENKLPVLGSAGTLDINFLATGTADGTKFVRDDGTLQTPTVTQSLAPLYNRTSNSSAVGSSSTSEATADTFNITANSLAAGYKIRGRLAVTYTLASGTCTLRMKIGGVQFWGQALSATGAGRRAVFDYEITVTTGGATGAIYSSIVLLDGSSTSSSAVTVYTDIGSDSSIDFTSTAAHLISAQFSASDASHSVVVNQWNVNRITTA